MVATLDNGHYTESVVVQPPLFDGFGFGGGVTGDIYLYLATSADDIPRWGTNVRTRDRMLRDFYKTENYLSGTVFGTSSRYSSFKWELHGPERMCNIMHRVLHASEHGRGWIHLMMTVVKDMLTQDNGGFIEIIRAEDSASSPVLQLNHLDSARCQRTGNWDTPVIYIDIYGSMHKMRYYQVIDVTEYPDPTERMRGYQECAVSRLLTNAQKMRDIAVYEREKVNGRNPASVHFVGGIPQQRIDNLLKLAQNREDQYGNLHYMVPPIMAALDQTARISHEQIDLRSLPDGYDKKEDFSEYIILLALAFGLDPQDIAPLPGGNMGSAQQSQVLAQKGRGKGPALFMSNIEHIMNFHGIMPKTVQFKFEEQDDAENEARTNLQWRRAQMYKLYATPTKLGPGQPGAAQAMSGTGNIQSSANSSGAGDSILPVAIIRQMMRDNGDLKQEYLDAMGESDITPAIDLSSDDTEDTVETQITVPTGSIPVVNAATSKSLRERILDVLGV